MSSRAIKPANIRETSFTVAYVNDLSQKVVIEKHDTEQEVLEAVSEIIGIEVAESFSIKDNCGNRYAFDVTLTLTKVA